MKESIEKALSKKEGKEKTVTEQLEEIKEADLERMKEDKTFRSPWLHIEPELLSNETQDIFSHFQDGEFEVAQGRLEEAREKISKTKKGKDKSSNEGFLQWIDNRIAAEIAKKELEEEKEKDNY
jgi:hypothetical protein